MMEQPQNNPYHKYNVGVHSMEAVKVIEPTTVCRWAALLHDVGKPECHTVDENGIDHFYGHNEKGAEIAVRCFADCGLTMKRQIWYARWCCGMIMV